ncbi:MAG TPA: laminin G domain-containing protein [Polyangia bacterium]|nr:laminin G domain-containing protein [Polyangia bacterium]
MTGQGATTFSMRFAIPALIAAIGTFGNGCAQLLGYTDITAADSGGQTGTGGGDTGPAGTGGQGGASPMGTGGGSGGTAVIDAGGSDGSSPDSVIDGSSNDSQDGADAASCSAGLSNVHTGDFLISFTMQTDQPDNFIGLADQRSICVGGLFWDAWLVNQHVRLEVSESSDNSRYASLSSTGAALNDNNPHVVVITRTKSVVTMVIDGVPVGSKTMDENLGSLPPLLIGSGRCPGVAAIKHTITNVCVRPN